MRSFVIVLDHSQLRMILIMNRLSGDPLQEFLTGLPTPGAGLYVSPAFEKIKHEYGVDTAKDFLAAYRYNDDEAALRVAKKISKDDGCKIEKSSLGYVFQLADEKHEILPPKEVVGPGYFDGYRSEAHSLLAAGLMYGFKAKALKSAIEEEQKMADAIKMGNKIF